jgi:osmotically-inducible protein OsmY
MTQQVKHALKEKNPGIQREVTVKTFDRVVSLGGTVSAPEDRAKLVSTAQNVRGVRAVLDYIKVKTPAGQKT